MELLRSGIHRSKFGEAAYIAINAALPLALLLLVRNFDSAYPALMLVLLSKWRVFALRPRFWWVNIKTNFLDIMVSAGVVGLLYLSMGSLPFQIVLTILYGVWLLYLKPRSDTASIMRQAAVAQFLALTVWFSLSILMHEMFVIVGCWVIGYVVARHVVSNYDEEYSEFLSLLWGLLLAQLGWLAYHWTVVYDLQLPVKIPQIALVAMVLGFAVARLYAASQADKLNESLVRMTVSFSGVLLVIILLFSRWDITI